MTTAEQMRNGKTEPEKPVVSLGNLGLEMESKIASLILFRPFMVYVFRILIYLTAGCFWGVLPVTWWKEIGPRGVWGRVLGGGGIGIGVVGCTIQGESTVKQTCMAW